MGERREEVTGNGPRRRGRGPAIGDPLPSWRAGATKEILQAFVRAVTTEGSADYVAPPDRVATFDNDGTLWVEHPTFVQGFFLEARVREMVRDDPTLAKDPAFAAVLSGDHAALHALGKRALVELAFRVHTGMTTGESERIAADWFERARHPRFARPFTECIYQPMRELMDHLRASGFAVYIVTGGGVDLVRSISEATYGVPRSHVIGSATRLRFEVDGDAAVLRKLPELATFDDREAKPVNLQAHIGRRPILAFGNSDGDIAMLEYATGAPGRRLGLLLHHDDAEREYAYDRDFALSPLREGLELAPERGWTIVSMKRDFARLFP